MRWGIVGAVLVLIVFAKSASAQPATTTVDADIITYDAIQQVISAQGNVRATVRQYRLFADAARFDLRTGVVTGTGRIRLVDALGRELRGRAITYNTRADEGTLEPVEGFFERRIYLRGSRLDVLPGRFIAHESTVTNCDPDRPVYRVVARRIEIVPDEEIVAYHASLYLGSRRLVTLPRYVVSLRAAEEGTQFPGFGTGSVDGLWVDYRFPVRVADARGQVHLKYGTQSGVFALTTLTRKRPAYTATLRVGRTQSADSRQAFNLLPYDVAEFGLTTAPRRIGATPFSWRVAGSAGWYTELFSTLSTSRFDGEVSVFSAPLPVAPHLALTVSAAYRVSAYGTGVTRAISRGTASLAYQLDPYTTVALGYARVIIDGPQPLTIDNIEPADTVSLEVARAVRDRYRVAALVAHNAALSETKLGGAVGVIVSTRWEFGVSVLYNTRLQAFEEIDYTVRYVCDCVDVIVRYRQMSREFSIEFGLMGFSEPRVPVVPRTIPVAPAPPPWP